MNGQFLGRKSLYPLLIVAVVIVALAGAAFLNGNVTAAPEGTTVTLEVPQGAAVGELIEVKLVADGAVDVAGFQATVSYDPAQLRLTGARLPEQLGNSGRDLLALGPVFRDDSVVIGAASCPVADCNVLARERVQRLPEGVDGRLELATLSFYVEQPGSYVLSLQEIKLVNPEGTALPQTSVDAVLDVANQ